MPVRESVLVVDDEEVNRELLSRRLTRSGFQVQVAGGGEEALGKVSQTQFDLVLLDQMMPGKSGGDVLRELRSHYSQADLPVIMVTAVTDSGWLRKLSGSGGRTTTLRSRLISPSHWPESGLSYRENTPKRPGG